MTDLMVEVVGGVVIGVVVVALVLFGVRATLGLGKKQKAVLTRIEERTEWKRQRRKNGRTSGT